VGVGSRETASALTRVEDDESARSRRTNRPKTTIAPRSIRYTIPARDGGILNLALIQNAARSLLTEVPQIPRN
jgi:hypothetical protein